MTSLNYSGPGASSYDTHRYNSLNQIHRFKDDSVLHMGLRDIAILAASPNWEDRIRAEVVRNRYNIITLPDQFPVIYEVQESPNLNRPMTQQYDPTRNVWVKSADISLLEAVLPIYQQVWDNYTSQWGPGSRRLFAIGHVDGVSVHGVYQPVATVADVIGETYLTHTELYSRQPEDLKAYHPRHAQIGPQ